MNRSTAKSAFVWQTRWLLLFFILLIALVQTRVRADDQRIWPDGIRGSLVICGGGNLPKPVYQRFVELAGGKSGRLVVIPTAGSDTACADETSVSEFWKEYSLESVKVLHTRRREQADRGDFVEPIKQATAVWFGGGQQSRIAAAYLGTAVEQELKNLLDRGGVIGGTSAGAAIQSRVMIESGNPEPKIAQGLDLLPDAIIDQHFIQRNRQPRLRTALQDHPGNFGLGIDEETAVVVTGRRIEVIGNHQATCLFRACGWRPEKTIELRSGDSDDLTAWRRAARERSKPVGFIPTKKSAAVSKGSLFIAGGGGLPSDALRRFVDLAGGPDARIVVLPTASESPAPDGAPEKRMFERLGVHKVTVLPGRSIEEVESELARQTVNDATAIWFGGGRQWRFVDAYEGTKMQLWLQDVLDRGGIIGGSSAGASIQAEYMVRGSPLGNREMMAEGYERGFGYLPGTAIDQHFTQRKRKPDMEGLVRSLPNVLGIGIDEGTVLLVRGSTAEVIGKHSVFFFDGDSDPANPIELRAGDQFDLNNRKRVESQPKSNDEPNGS